MVDDSSVRKGDGVGKGALKKVNELSMMFGDSFETFL